MTKLGWGFVVAALTLVYVLLPNRNPSSDIGIISTKKLSTKTLLASSIPASPPVPMTIAPMVESDVQAVAESGSVLSIDDKLSILVGRGPSTPAFKSAIETMLRKYGERTDADGFRRLTNVLGGLAQEYALSPADLLVCVADQPMMTKLPDAAGACAAILRSMK